MIISSDELTYYCYTYEELAQRLDIKGKIKGVAIITPRDSRPGHDVEFKVSKH